MTVQSPAIRQIGPHRVKCGNLLDGIDDLMQGRRADVLYSDPPWGPGNLAYWQTLRERQTGVPREHVDFPCFLDAFFRLAAEYCTGPVFVEYGRSWEAQLVDAAARAGLKRYAVIDLVYRAGGNKMLPHHLHIFSVTPLVVPSDYVQALTGTYGAKTSRIALSPFVRPGTLVLDPCCGRGYTARATVPRGGTFYGLELNQKRLDETISYLERQVGRSG